MATWKCFDHDKRVQLEALYRAGHTKKEMAAILGCHLSSIYRELKKGSVSQLGRDLKPFVTYSASYADIITRQRRSNCGCSLKLPSEPALTDFICRRLKYYKYSPGAISAELRRSDLGYVSKQTIYRYIQSRYFDGVRLSDLPHGGKYRRLPAARPVRSNRYGRSIELRSPEISQRSTFGHWEMDTVIGTRSGAGALLVLTERLTRYEMIFKLPDKGAAGVHRVLHQLRRKGAFGSIIKTITMDNGSEFASVHQFERYGISCFYCHPYCSSERGSNENNNRLIRRWLPKGTPLRSVTASDCALLARWMNTYPRGILGGKTSLQALLEACEKENINLPDKICNFLLT